jgi:hypothetical protein
MLELGYALSSEEHSPTELLNFAQQAEAVGFNFAMLSDHGPDPRVHNKAIQKFVDAVFDHVYMHQIGPNQQDFSRFYQEQVLPQVDASRKNANGSKNANGTKSTNVKSNDSDHAGRRGKPLGRSHARA